MSVSMPDAPSRHWVTTWAASAQGSFPVGSPTAQPDLSAALPDARLGLVDQSFRMIVRPAAWSSRMRLRLSNHFGDRTVQLRGVNLALHLGGGALVPGTSIALPDQAVPAGESAWTPAFDLPWLEGAHAAWLQGRALAFSAWVDGASGPITWHAKAMASSYIAAPGDTRAAGEDGESRFPHATTSTFFVDALDACLPLSTHTVVALGDSLTDGTATTLNGHDRWTDVIQRMLWAEGEHDLVVVNAGIGGNQVVGPAASSVPWRGGPAAATRLERDVLSLSGVKTVVWLQGINDFSDNGRAEAEEVIEAMRVASLHLARCGIQVIGVTVPPAFGSEREGHGGWVQETRRRTFNAAVRSGRIFERFVDLDLALRDPETGGLRAAFDGDSTFGEPGDGLHPNRAGHAMMASVILSALR